MELLHVRFSCLRRLLHLVEDVVRRIVSPVSRSLGKGGARGTREVVGRVLVEGGIGRLQLFPVDEGGGWSPPASLHQCRYGDALGRDTEGGGGVVV